MKRFLLWGFATLIIALLSAAAMFFYIQSLPQPLPNETTSTTSDTTTTDTSAASTVAPASGANTTVTEPIPLRTLPLSDSQRSLIETAGIDVDTYVITPDSIECAKSKLGTARFNEIVAGSQPGVIEASKLLSCI